MKNFEKYEEAIKEVGVVGLAIEKRPDEIIAITCCENIPCDDCAFHDGIRACDVNLINWLYEDAEPEEKPNTEPEESRVFESGAKRDSDTNKNRPDLIPVECLWRLGWLYKAGADHYGIDNWKKGIPTREYEASLMRHIYKYLMGYKDEDHLASAVFNIFGIMYNEITEEKENKENE